MTTISTIGDAGEFESLCNALTGAPYLSLDTEFMREKTYAPKLALIQVATDTTSACIDPLAIDDLSPFATLLADVDLPVILHSCRQDLEALDTRMDVDLRGLFDTQIAAAFCGYGDQVSYAAMVERVSGVALAKSHTRADWTRRPLSDDELGYALDDVRYLRAIQSFLEDKLASTGYRAWFDAECRAQTDPAYWRANPDDAWVRLKGAARLPVDAQETARQLAVWREHRAISRDMPREWVLASQTLLEISRRAPTDESALAAIDGVHRNVIRHSARDILEIIDKLPRDKNAEPLWTAREMLDPTGKKRLKTLMALLRETAESLDISPSLLANRTTLERYVRGERALPLFEGWRGEVVGERILAEDL